MAVMQHGHSPFRRAVALAALTWGILAATACAGQQKGKVVEKTLDTMSEEQRRSAFDTMAAVLDRNPELVDEFYLVAREHPEMFHRFLANSARDLKEPALARETAVLLVANPASLEQVMHQTMVLAGKDPEGRAVLARVIVAEREIVADILADNPRALGKTTGATLRALLGELAE
jgi:hypothetical protein